MEAAQDMTLDAVRVDAGPKGQPPVTIFQTGRLVFPAACAAALVGPSGSGKSTCLEVMAAIAPVTGGTVAWGDEVLSGRSEAECDRWRRRTIGMVFQDFNLIAELSVAQNILLPVYFDHSSVSAAIKARAAALMQRLHLCQPDRRAGLLSRGEQQRVAIARALLRSPRLILADEPTASLDEGNGAQVAELLISEAEALGATLIVATHDRALIARLPRRVSFLAGRATEMTP